MTYREAADFHDPYAHGGPLTAAAMNRPFAQLDGAIGDLAAFVNVRTKGAAGDGSDDPTAAFQAAIAEVIARGLAGVYVPTGIYDFPVTSASLEVGAGDIQFVGDGSAATIIRFHGSTVGKSLFVHNPASWGVGGVPSGGHVAFRGIQFAGDWSAGVGFAGGDPIAMYDLKSLEVTDCWFHDMPTLTIYFYLGWRLLVRGCRFERNAADCIFAPLVYNATITDNYFAHTNDDAISLHQYLPGVEHRGQPSEGIIIANNTFEDTCGIHIIGGQVANIHDNIFRRWKLWGVFIEYADDNPDLIASPPPFAISVHDNLLLDGTSRSGGAPFDGAPTYGIGVVSAGRKSAMDSTATVTATTLAAVYTTGTNVKLTSVTGLLVGMGLTVDEHAAQEFRRITAVGTAGAGGTGVTLTSALAAGHASGATATVFTVPGENIAATGVFKRMEPFRKNWWDRVGYSTPPSHHISIRGNTILRSLPAVAAYSDWGYGEKFTASFGYVDPAVTEADTRPSAGISVEGDARWIVIAENIIAHVYDGIVMSAPTSHFAGDGSIITANLITDYIGAGVHTWPGAFSMHMAIRGNTFDGDPYHDHVNRASGQLGRWKDRATWGDDVGPFAVRTGARGFSFDHNTVKNVYAPLDAGSPVDARDNKVHANAAGGADGAYHATNAGVAIVPTPGAGWVYLTTVSDPHSTSYGDVTAIAP